MKFSVLMSVYKNDKAEYLEEALNSVINQTVKPDEVILVEDGPVGSELKDIIKQFEDTYSFFKTIPLEENLGLGNALEVGLNYCSYDIVARMDSDDICVKDRFQKQILEFEKDNELSIIGGQIEEFIDSKENIVGKREVPLENDEIRRYIKSRCPFNHMTVMFRKEDVQKVGGYIEWHYNEDYYLWLRMYMEKCKFKNMPDTLVYARVGKEMYQRRGGKKYFKSELGIQKYMLENKIIGIFKYVKNIILRFILQVMMPNKLRAFIFKNFARKRK